MAQKLFLLDAFALVFRAYYALIRNPRLTSKGKNTNAQFGFTNTLVELLTKQLPSHMAVCFDTAAPTERHAEFENYKANRQQTPEDILAAVPDIKSIIRGFNIPVIECDGYEADDVIGTLSKQAAKSGYDVLMVTPDKDYGQLVSDKVKMYKPGYQGTDVEILGPAEVCAKWNIQTVAQVIDILGLMGDAVDNIPGIAGVGEKTAAKLLAEYHTLENVLINADNIKGALGEKIRRGKEDAILSKKLATIITDVPVEFHEENFKIKEWDKEKLSEIFTELEFKTLGKRLLGDGFSIASSLSSDGVITKAIPKGVQTDLFGNIIESSSQKTEEIKVLNDNDDSPAAGLAIERNINNTPHSYENVVGSSEIHKLVTTLKNHLEICFDTETTSIDANDAELVGLSFSIKPGEAWYVACPADQKMTKEILAHFESLFADKNKTWVGQNIKYDMLVLKWYGVEIAGNLFDTMLAHYVIEPDGKRSMDVLSAKYLGYEPVHIEELIGKKGKTQSSMRDVQPDKIKDYAAEDADITFQLKKVFEPLLKEKEVEKVFNEVENSLIKVLTNMEYEGIKVDVEFLTEYSQQLKKEAKTAEESVYKQAGVRFNLASPKQLGEVLFEKLKLDMSAKKNKNGAIPNR